MFGCQRIQSSGSGRERLVPPSMNSQREAVGQVLAVGSGTADAEPLGQLERPPVGVVEHLEHEVLAEGEGLRRR